MTYTIRNTYASPPFRFVIEGRSFYVHRELVAKYSVPLDRMMNGGMKESQEGFAMLEDVDEGTFIRFTEFLYTGFYSPAEHTLLTRPQQPRLSSTENLDTFNEYTIVSDDTAAPFSPPLVFDSRLSRYSLDKPVTAPRGPARSVGYRTTRAAAREIFISRQQAACVRNNARKAPQVRSNKSDGEDYSEVFLCHARVYVFANMYQIPVLKRLALEELQASLAAFELYERRTCDIVKLLRYIYTETTFCTSEGETLGTVMRHYMASEMETLIKDEGFKSLLIEDGGPLLGDLMRVVARRLA